MTAVEIVTGDANDLPAIVALMRSAFDPRFGEAWSLSQAAGVLVMPGAELLLARRKRRLLGFALSRTILEDAELMLLAVDPQARRIGIGSQLLQAVMARAQMTGARKLHLEVRKGNGAVALYQRHGLQLVGERPRYYRGPGGEVFDAQTFSRDLIDSANIASPTTLG